MTPLPRPTDMRTSFVTAPALLLVAVALGLATSCHPDEPSVPAGPCPPGQFQPGGCTAGQPPPGPYAPGGPTAPPTPLPGLPSSPAVGFPCQTDLDLQCPLARCVVGRCGGCATSADCKQGATCAWTPVGMACILGFGGSAPGPAPAPVPPPPIGGPAGGDPFASARQACVDRTNQFRAQVGQRPLSRNAAREPCGDQAAQSDGTTGRIHGAFGQCGEWAQNECPSWRGPPDAMVGPCLQMMFDEGPGPGTAHGHYTNMTNAKYGAVACGFYMTGDGKVWMVQNFF